MTQFAHVSAIFDSHFHFRQGNELIRQIVWDMGIQFCGVLVMPNLLPSITTGQQARVYEDQIRLAGFTGALVMTIKLTPDTTPQMVFEAHGKGIRAIKVYPSKKVRIYQHKSPSTRWIDELYLQAGTTHSDDGIDFCDPAWVEKCTPALEVANKLGLHVLFHGESPLPDPYARESAFLVGLKKVIDRFPELRVTLEHITTAEAVKFVERYSDLGKFITATITAHHFLLHRGHVVGSTIRPHHHCLPVAKTEYDRFVLLQAAFGGKACFRLGSDSAPHSLENKECSDGCAGVYTAPILLPLLYQIFEMNDALDHFQGFAADRGIRHFDLDIRPHSVTLEKRRWVVPQKYGTVVPLLAGQELLWQVVD